MSNAKIALWIVIAALFAVALFLIFKAGAAGAASTAGSAVKTAAASSSGAMVGGC